MLHTKGIIQNERQDIIFVFLINIFSITSDIPPGMSTKDMIQNLTRALDRNISTTNIPPVLDETDSLQISTSDKSILTTDIPLVLSTLDLLQNLRSTSSEKNVSMTTDIPTILSTTDLLQNLASSTDLSSQYNITTTM